MRPLSDAVDFCRVGQIAVAMQTHRSLEHLGNGGSSRPDGTLDPPYIKNPQPLWEGNCYVRRSVALNSSGLGTSPRQEC